MTESSDPRAAVASLRKWLEAKDLAGLMVMFNTQRGLIRVEVDKGQKLPAGLVLAATVSTSEDKLVAILPVRNIGKITTYKPMDISKGTRLYDNGDGTFSDAEYAVLKVVGITKDGSFALDTLGRNNTGLAGTVPYTTGRR